MRANCIQFLSITEQTNKQTYCWSAPAADCSRMRHKHHYKRNKRENWTIRTNERKKVYALSVLFRLWFVTFFFVHFYLLVGFFFGLIDSMLCANNLCFYCCELFFFLLSSAWLSFYWMDHCCFVHGHFYFVWMNGFMVRSFELLDWITHSKCYADELSLVRWLNMDDIGNFVELMLWEGAWARIHFCQTFYEVAMS